MRRFSAHSMPDRMSASAPPQDQASWMDGLADFLAESSGVEAILLNPDQRRVSVATLGNVDTDLLKKKLEEVIRALDRRFGAHGFGPAGIASQPMSSAFAVQV